MEDSSKTPRASSPVPRARGRRAPSRRPPKLTVPGWLPWRIAVHRGAARVVLALGTGQLGDLHVHQLAHDLQARGAPQSRRPAALGHVRGKGGQVLLHPAGQPLRQPLVAVGTSRSGLASGVAWAADAAVWESCMRGPPPTDLVVPGASHLRRSGEDPTSNPTDLRATSEKYRHCAPLISI